MTIYSISQQGGWLFISFFFCILIDTMANFKRDLGRRQNDAITRSNPTYPIKPVTACLEHSLKAEERLSEIISWTLARNFYWQMHARGLARYGCRTVRESLVEMRFCNFCIKSLSRLFYKIYIETLMETTVQMI